MRLPIVSVRTISGAALLPQSLSVPSMASLAASRPIRGAVCFVFAFVFLVPLMPLLALALRVVTISTSERRRSWKQKWCRKVTTICLLKTMSQEDTGTLYIPSLLSFVTILCEIAIDPDAIVHGSTVSNIS